MLCLTYYLCIVIIIHDQYIYIYTYINKYIRFIILCCKACYNGDFNKQMYLFFCENFPNIHILDKLDSH